MFLQGTAVYAAPLKSDQHLVLTVKSSSDSDNQSKLTIHSPKIVKTILKKGVHQKTNRHPISDTHLIVNYRGTSKTYKVDPFTNLFDEQSSETIVLPLSVKEELNEYINDLKSRHYGKLMDWQQAKKAIPRKSIVTVIDLETGLQFQVQRRAGSNHADMQPVTQRDTEIMKRIYEGQWSWKRKAIVVRKDELFLAASMHGMPHGGDGIPDNGFRGHFCIHFLGSSTHGSGNVDRAHQIMVYKAAGKLPQYIQQFSPYDIIETFFIAINQKDADLLKMLFSQPKQEQVESVLHHMKQIKVIQKSSKFDERESLHLLAVDIPLKANIFPTAQKAKGSIFTLQLRRISLTDPWKIDYIQNNPLSQ